MKSSMQKTLDHTLLGKSDNHKKISQAEKALLIFYRKKYFDELKNELKIQLRDEYTDKDAEDALQFLIEKDKEDGTFQSILQDILNNKIQREREKFLGPARAQL